MVPSKLPSKSPGIELQFPVAFPLTPKFLNVATPEGL